MEQIFKEYLTSTEDKKVKVSIYYNKNNKLYSLHLQPLKNIKSESGFTVEEYEPTEGLRTDIPLELKRRSKNKDKLAIQYYKDNIESIKESLKNLRKIVIK